MRVQGLTPSPAVQLREDEKGHKECGDPAWRIRKPGTLGCSFPESGFLDLLAPCTFEGPTALTLTNPCLQSLYFQSQLPSHPRKPEWAAAENLLQRLRLGGGKTASFDARILFLGLKAFGLVSLVHYIDSAHTCLYIYIPRA